MENQNISQFKTETREFEFGNQESFWRDLNWNQSFNNRCTKVRLFDASNIGPILEDPDIKYRGFKTGLF